MLEIDEKIRSLLSSDSTLQTLLGGTATTKKVYPSLPNQDESFPCITYENTGSRENTTPASTQQTDYDIHIYTKTSYDELSQITERVKTLLKYYHSASPRIFHIVKTNEVNQNEDDRQLFTKVIQFTVWSYI